MAANSAAEPDLESMTKAQLLAIANERGITGVNNSTTKARIIEAIRENDAGESTDIHP